MVNPRQILRISLGRDFSLDELSYIINEANLSDLRDKNHTHIVQHNTPHSNISQTGNRTQQQPTTQNTTSNDRNITSQRTKTSIDNLLAQPWQSLQTCVDNATRTIAICLAQVARIANFQPHIDQLFPAKTQTITTSEHDQTSNPDTPTNQDTMPTTEELSMHRVINEEIK